MPICPKCGECFKTEARLCINNLSQKQGQSVSISEEKYFETFNTIKEQVMNSLVGTEWRTSDLIEFFEVEDITNGDLLRKTLEILVCKGILKKIKFGNERSGHVWVRTENVNENHCPYFICKNKGKIRCRFDWKNDAKIVEY